VPELEHPARRFSDLSFLLAQALVLFRGWTEDVGLVVILQQRLELGADVVLSFEGQSLPPYTIPAQSGQDTVALATQDALALGRLL